MINPQKADLEQGKTLTLCRLHSRETVDEVNLKNNLILEPINAKVQVSNALLRCGLVAGGCLSSSGCIGAIQAARTKPEDNLSLVQIQGELTPLDRPLAPSE